MYSRDVSVTTEEISFFLFISIEWRREIGKSRKNNKTKRLTTRKPFHPFNTKYLCESTWKNWETTEYMNMWNGIKIGKKKINKINESEKKRRKRRRDYTYTQSVVLKIIFVELASTYRIQYVRKHWMLKPNMEFKASFFPFISRRFTGKSIEKVLHFIFTYRICVAYKFTVENEKRKDVRILFDIFFFLSLRFLLSFIRILSCHRTLVYTGSDFRLTFTKACAEKKEEEKKEKKKKAKKKKW